MTGLKNFAGVLPLENFYGAGHRDQSKHIERACQLHGAKLTRHGLVHKGFNISLLSLMDMHIVLLNSILRACILLAGHAHRIHLQLKVPYIEFNFEVSVLAYHNIENNDIESFDIEIKWSNKIGCFGS